MVITVVQNEKSKWERWDIPAAYVIEQHSAVLV